MAAVDFESSVCGETLPTLIDNKRGDFAVLKISLFALLMTVAANMPAVEPPADSAPLYQMQAAKTQVNWSSTVADGDCAT